MKKQFIILLMLCISLLCACSSEKIITGQVIAVSSETDESTQYVILTKEGKEIGIKMNAETFVSTWIDEFQVESFKSGKIEDVMITVKCDNSSSSLIPEEGKGIKAYIANDIQITAILTRDVLKLSDGKSVDKWNYFGNTVYQLNNGDELLSVQEPSGPNNVEVMGIEGFDDLGKVAQSNILSYYIERGLLYDVNIELEKAYSDYKNTENKSEFRAYFLSQDIAPASSNEKIIYFLTSVMYPIDKNHGYEMRYGAAFNKETGEHISNWKLFSCSEEDVKQTILDIAGITDIVLRAEMEASFQPEHIILFTDNLEVSFPAGTLSSHENSYILGLDYDNDLSKILNEWAIPKRSD